jgi:hypothetical protein
VNVFSLGSSVLAKMINTPVQQFFWLGNKVGDIIKEREMLGVSEKNH